MSSPTPAKRRKLHDATSKLSRPFVSPMRTVKPIDPELNETVPEPQACHVPYTPSIIAHTTQDTLPSHPSRAHTKHIKPDSNQNLSGPANKRAPFTKLSPEELAVQKAITSVELQIRKVQNDLDTLKQARQLSESSTDADLEQLAEKWRLVSQAVAEDLFGSVRERVNRMGGVAAWRDMEKKKHDRTSGLGQFAKAEEQEDDDADCEFDSAGEELPEDEQEYRKKLKRQAQREMMEAADVVEPEEDKRAKTDQIWQDDGNEDDTFTMDMMLRSLNIDLSLIGYDKLQQKWIV